MGAYETVTLARDVEAVEIPSGLPVRLPAGTRVTITQALGGAYTVITERGAMARVSERDADALGQPSGLPTAAAVPVEEEAAGRGEAPLTAEALEARVWEELRGCYDPEIPVNIVELGLVYRCEVRPRPEGGYRVEIDFTLTAPGCGMGPVLQADIERKVLALPGVREADVQLVFEPAWDPSRMSDAARLELGFM